jgi:tight adherence protein C
MNLIITFVFGAVFLIVLALMYAISGDATVTRRLSALWGAPRSRKDREGGPTAAVEEVLANLGKLMPVSEKDLTRKQAQIIQAGIRKPGAALVARGLMIALPITLVCVVYLTGIYKFDPFLVFILAAAIGYASPDLWLRWKVRQRQTCLRLSLPDALDLLVICVEAGLGLDQAILRVSDELHLTHPELAEELKLVNLETRVGKPRIEAFRGFSMRTGVDDIKALVAMLIQTDRFGTSLAQALRVHSEDLRVRRRQRAEEMAAKTTVKMVFPLVFFIFPTLMIVILGPAVITLIRQFLPAFK